MSSDRIDACFIVFILLLMLLASCSTPLPAPPPPTPQVVNIALSPAAAAIKDRLTSCSAKQPEIALFLNEIPAPSQELGQFDLNIRVGNPPQESTAYFSAPVAWEEIVVIVNATNQQNTLTLAELHAIFAGRLTYWEDNQPIQVWVYPNGDDLRYIFDAAILAAEPVSPFASLAPDPTAMLQVVAKTPSAIGYIPSSWLKSSDVQTVSLNEKPAEALHQPILALAPEEPFGVIRTLLICLQSH